MKGSKFYRREGGRFYGFVESSEPAPLGNRYWRLNLVLDAVDADDDDASPDATLDRKALAIIRITTTHDRLEAAPFNLARVPIEGDWVEVRLQRRANYPIAWVVTLADDYQGEAARLNVVE